MAETTAPKAWGPTPSPRQLAWHQLEYYGFVHFTTNTFTGKEWGFGDESPAIFNPTDLDANQWARVASEAGMKGLILTTKHHDGFCLWPSPHTEHSVAASGWKDGKGSVVREFVDACRENGLKVGFYLSPWDRNRADYGTEGYVKYYQAQLAELTTEYGDLFEFWFDGANGGDGFYGGANEMRRVDKANYYGFPKLWQTVRDNQPQAVLFSDAGPDIRWIGNEEGQAPDVCWNRINPEGIVIGDADQKRLAHGEADGTKWLPAEVDVSIRKGWFYHPEETPKTPDKLMEIYMNSVGRGCCLLLNITPDRRGLIPDEDIESLRQWKKQIDALYAREITCPQTLITASNIRGGSAAFAPSNVIDTTTETYWATDDDITEASITMEFGQEHSLGLVRVEEFIQLGQRVESFEIAIRQDGREDPWTTVATGGTIGARRLVNLNGQKANALRVSIKALACPVISRLSVFEA